MKKPRARDALSLLFSFSRGARRYLVITLAAYLVVTAASFAAPQILRILLDNVIAAIPFAAKFMPEHFNRAVNEMIRAYPMQRMIVLCGAAYLLTMFVSNLFSYVQRMSLFVATERMTKTMRNRLFSHIQNLPFSWHVDNKTGDIIQRCISDVEQVDRFLAHDTMELLRCVLMTVAAIFLMLQMNRTLALWSMALLPVILGYSFFFHKKISRRFRIADESEGALSAIAQENLTGVRVVRAFGREAFEKEKFSAFNEDFTNLWIRLGSLLSLTWATGDFLSGLQLVIVMSAGVVLASRGAITPATFIIFLTYNSMLIWPVRSMGRIIAEMGKMRISLRRIKEILDASEEPRQPEGIGVPIGGDIVFDNVSFAYTPGGRRVLENVSFTVKEGQTLAILGGTGSGKTTLTYLLARLYDLKEGEGRITIGGRDIKTIDRQYLRTHIGLILQEPFLFSRSIRENLVLDRSDIAEEQVRRAVQTAAMEDTVAHLKEGYETVIGERGVTLSGGQRQRMAIARTLLRKPPILVFDDSLSAVDTETDAKIRRGLKDYTEKVTTIIISHRISTIMQADCILVLACGRVADIGTHAQLVARGGVYSRIFQTQSSMEEELAREDGDTSAAGEGAVL